MNAAIKLIVFLTMSIKQTPNTWKLSTYAANNLLFNYVWVDLARYYHIKFNQNNGIRSIYRKQKR